MQVYLINLERNPERLAAADAQLRRLGVAYTRVAAVDGRSLPKGTLRREVARFWWWCHRGYLPQRGQVGCALSHRTVWRLIAEGEEACACILEDDAVLDGRFPEQLRQTEAFLRGQEGPAAVLLSYHVRDFVDPNAPSAPETWGFSRTDADVCTEGYVLNREGAANLLRANRRICLPCDQWDVWVRWGLVRLWHAFPTVCRQNWSDFKSEVTAGGRWTGWRRPFWVPARAVGKVLWALRARERVARAVDSRRDVR